MPTLQRRARNVQLHEGNNEANAHPKDPKFEAVFVDPVIEGPGRVVVENRVGLTRPQGKGHRRK